MTARKAEQVLAALAAALTAALPSGVVLARNESLPARIPAGGAVILRDGDPGEPAVTLSPLTWHYQHRAEVDVLVDRLPATRDAVFDALVRAVGLAVAADRTLGGLCDWIEGESPAPLALVIDGADSLKAATVTVVLHYHADDPLG